MPGEVGANTSQCSIEPHPNRVQIQPEIFLPDASLSTKLVGHMAVNESDAVAAYRQSSRQNPL
jgi:hypothetical protein